MQGMGCNTLTRMPLTVAPELGCHYLWLTDSLITQLICPLFFFLFHSHTYAEALHIIQLWITYHIHTVISNFRITIHHLIYIWALSSTFNSYITRSYAIDFVRRMRDLEYQPASPSSVSHNNLCATKETYCGGWAHSSVNKTLIHMITHNKQ